MFDGEIFMPQDISPKFNAWEFAKIVQEAAKRQAAKEAKKITAKPNPTSPSENTIPDESNVYIDKKGHIINNDKDDSKKTQILKPRSDMSQQPTFGVEVSVSHDKNDKSDKYSAWEFAKIIQEAAKAQAAKEAARIAAKPKECICPSDEAYKAFTDKVSYLMTTNTYDTRVAQNDFSKEHVSKVLPIINTALDLAAKWSTQDGRIIHHRREQLLYALLLIVKYREEKNTQDITFRDAGHYFAGRLQEWQTKVKIGGNEGVNPEKEPSKTLSYLSDAVDRTYDNLKELGFDIRSNPAHPAAPPGNIYWATLGEEHYRSYDDTGSSDKYSIVEKPSEKEAVQAAKVGEISKKVDEEMERNEIYIDFGKRPFGY
jgi:hypothetical protein